MLTEDIVLNDGTVTDCTNCYYLIGCASDKTTAQFGIGNATEGSTTADTNLCTEGKTLVQFASGEVIYLLNGTVVTGDTTTWAAGPADGTQAFYQNIDNGVTPYDASPRFTGGTVYYYDGKYSNYSCITAGSSSIAINEADKLIFADITGLSDIDTIITPRAGYTVTATPSLSGQGYSYCGTGTVITVTTDSRTVETYTLIVNSDVNGDSVCDALDVMFAELVLNRNLTPATPEQPYYDVDRNGEYDINDFQQIMNCAVGIR